MKSALKEPFSHQARAIVSKPLVFDGKRYEVGEEFPWRKVGCSVRKARQLWENRFLCNEEAAPKPAPAPTKAKAEKPKPAPKASKSVPTKPAPAQETSNEEVAPEAT